MRVKFNAVTAGFTILEMLVALSLGVLVLGVAVDVYSKGMQASWVVSQRAELQQDARASFNILTKDISMANSGLSDTPFFVGIGLATGGAGTPKIGCDYTGACHLGGANGTNLSFPVSGGVNAAYGIIPGFQRSAVINGFATDSITIIYLDTAFLLNEYQIKFNDINGNSVTFGPQAVVPATPPQPVNDPGVGLQQGDLVLFQSGTFGSVAEVTAAVPAGGGPTYTVAFANLSPLGFNQNGATSGNLNRTVIQNNPANVGVFLPIATVTASRLWMITYYIDNTKPTPTLMRMVNGRLPVPVAENVMDLRFLYSSLDANGNTLAPSGDGGLTAAPPIMPSAIRSIALTHLTVRGQAMNKSGYQSIDLHTSISARNMGFVNRYQ